MPRGLRSGSGSRSDPHHYAGSESETSTEEKDPDPTHYRGIPYKFKTQTVRKCDASSDTKDIPVIYSIAEILNFTQQDPELYQSEKSGPDPYQNGLDS
jgi:hypothetical protein